MANVRERLIARGLDPVDDAPAEFAEKIDEELVKWRRVTRAAGLKPE